MSSKRMAIAVVVGLLSGIFCAVGTAQMADEGKFDFEVTNGLLASTVYNRILIGLVVGLAGGIAMHPVLRGALAGAIVSMAISIHPIVDGNPMGGLMPLLFGIAYGVIADVLSTRYGR
ncbi:MAG: hypothetical protein GF416_07775 [Candidatus Altiarchaeales archaeon]|nr:hypothetical protein [Candidatus Altiarchaeales archaeon]MBD3417011.1 hypothetical protein [Candidatus Altiarchaeales archaeon]